ncbi:MAG TPA: tRNA preQ1(34) S-adenosylmethionine ribosyltransferase-isomerase QueA [Alphaproteobacteria bacterium]|nr:tRNA preQ1(34) S-adenosylmethionine ribosyltransferase-isomerase QueA [Alphaproteobacteria bacterium]
MLGIDAFDFELPESLIARRPVVPRDAARLLEVGPALRDLHVRDLPALLSPGDVLVFNDTRVIEARLAGVRPADPATGRGEARIEVTLHKQAGPETWQAFVRPAKRLRPGDRIAFAPDFACSVASKGEEGEVVLRFDCGGERLRAALARHGAMPLPPYIASKRAPDARDRTDYQTMFARESGAVAAPTAGLHFTPQLIAALEARGIACVPVTLHVGAGTFLPVKTENVLDHRMHSEAGHISAETARTVNQARKRGGRVVAVGSTVLRLLEAAADDSGVRAFSGETGIFITPGFRFRAVDLMLTNFHLPRSTLFILVCAFAGLGRMRAAYAHAVAQGYRFYSYGDCCLLHRAEAR